MQEATPITDEVQFLDAPKVKIARDSFEELTIELPDGTSHTNVEAIRSFPLTDSCLLYTSPSPRDRTRSRMPSSA